MLKTLDILIGATTVLLIFSMAVTVITQAVTSLFQQRGKHLLAGVTNLLQQLGISSKDAADKIAKALLTHPALAGTEKKLATVVHRGEFTKLLMDIASGQGLVQLEPTAMAALQKMLADQGVPDPKQTLSNIRALSLQIETLNPELASHVREQMAILQECATDYVAKVHAWFDQTMDRVSQAFTQHAQRVNLVAAAILVLVVQLDIVAVINRLSIDEQFRNAVVTGASEDFKKSAESTSDGLSTQAQTTHKYYDLLNEAGLVTLPTNGFTPWFGQLADGRKFPGMILSVLLLSLGAPFWYNILKQLLGLKSLLAVKDDAQRAQRQSSQAGSGAAKTPPPSNRPPDWLKGEQGPMPAAG